ncbi:ribosomal protein S5 domain 2-type protein [Limtongia smithiae]|uniref:ribosomal protein S5 domain 2-type protein n=1 Tax=Limtongia smithiae TaxID=1125753 RepID=UPI0034CD795C
MSEELEEELFSINIIYEGCMNQQSSSIFLVYPPSVPELAIQISFPAAYPASPPSILSVSAPPSLEKHLYHGPGHLPVDVEFLSDTLHACYRPGEVCVFDFLDSLNDALIVDDEYQRQRRAAAEAISIAQSSGTHTPPDEAYESSDDGVDSSDLGWAVSDMIVDRKSKFVGRAHEVHSVQEAQAKLAILKTNKKIARAQHNMTAWRIKPENGSMTIQDCDDDGESAAGSRLLHLLTLMDMWNVMVVVTRWFGGTHIGPDRFKHINNAARDALVKGGFVVDGTNDKAKKGKKSSKSSKR